MLDIVKQLFENNVISEEIKSEVYAYRFQSKKLQLDIDTNIDKAIAKRASKVEQYLETQFPDYGGDPEDTSNILPSFVHSWFCFPSWHAASNSRAAFK